MDEFKDVRLKVDSKVFFALTRKYKREEALEVVMHAAASTILAIRAMGGRVSDTQELYGQMAHALGLPHQKSFRLIRAVLIQMKWIEVLTSITTAGTKRTLSLTEKGMFRAASFGEFLKDALPQEEADDPTAAQPAN